jgi:hypothetical protein
LGAGGGYGWRFEPRFLEDEKGAIHMYAHMWQPSAGEVDTDYGWSVDIGMKVTTAGKPLTVELVTHKPCNSEATQGQDFSCGAG